MDGSFTLPRTLRVALLRLESPQQKRYYWGDEQYLKTQQAYLELFSQNLKNIDQIALMASRKRKDMAKRRLAFSGLFNLIIVAGIVLGGKLAPAGPCTPGGDMAAVFLGGLASVGLFLKNACQVMIGESSRKYPLALHGIVSASWILVVIGVAA